jgi:hypothetical protein
MQFQVPTYYTRWRSLHQSLASRERGGCGYFSYGDAGACSSFRLLSHLQVGLPCEPQKATCTRHAPSRFTTLPLSQFSIFSI